jgi:hypothetical protein
MAGVRVPFTGLSFSMKGPPLLIPLPSSDACSSKWLLEGLQWQRDGLKVKLASSTLVGCTGKVAGTN